MRKRDMYRVVVARVNPVTSRIEWSTLYRETFEGASIARFDATVAGFKAFMFSPKVEPVGMELRRAR